MSENADRPIDASMPILVVTFGQGVFNHVALSVARSAGPLGIPVYCLTGTKRMPWARSRYWAGQFAQPGEGASPKEWVAALREIGRRLGEAILVPADDDTIVIVADHAEQLREFFRFPDQPMDLIRNLSDKRELHQLCLELDIPVAEAEFPRSRGEVSRLAERLDYPVVAKRIAQWLPARDSEPPSVVIAHTEEALLEAHDRMDSPEEPNVMLQEYIPGGSASIWMFNGYFDRRSECLLGITGRKLRQRGPNTGPATLGDCAQSPTVGQQTRTLMEKVGYRGILDIGYRYDARDGRYKLLDVNPRLGETFRLFVGSNGIDVLRALYLDLTDQSVPATGVDEHRKWIVEPGDMITSAQLWRAGELRPRDWIRSLRGIDEAAWFARDDPMPFLAMLMRSIPELIRRGNAAY